MPHNNNDLIPLSVVAPTFISGTVIPVMTRVLAIPEVTSEWSPNCPRQVISYLTKHSAVLAETATPDTEWNPEVLFRPPKMGVKNARRIAGFPSPAPHIFGLVGGRNFGHRVLKSIWKEYCLRKPRSNSKDEVYYAEPTAHWVPSALRMAGIPAHTIIVIRDPRSEIAEAWFSARRRGLLPRFMSHVDTPITFAQRAINRQLKKRLRVMVSIRNDEQTTALRYEDCLASPNESLTYVRERLGLPGTTDIRFPSTTHEWPKTRWQAVLPQTINDLVKEELGPEMDELGYAI